MSRSEKTEITDFTPRDIGDFHSIIHRVKTRVNMTKLAHDLLSVGRRNNLNDIENLKFNNEDQEILTGNLM